MNRALLTTRGLCKNYGSGKSEVQILKSIDLEKIYNFHPIPEELDSNYHDFIIGGECNMWTEHVPDEETLDQKVFPRMLGMSEALWSSSEKDYADFNLRIRYLS